MTDYQDYYNSFYKALSALDAKGNSFHKISPFLPQGAFRARVLDVGCGYGSVSQGLVDRGCDVYGMEINQDVSDVLKGRGIKHLAHDFSQPFPSNIGTFDLVLLLDILEHVFDPVAVLQRAKGVLSANGAMIISVPLYFDIIDRIRILFTGSVVSYDNRVYGKDLYKKFRSFNYDHIRFFRPCEVKEMVSLSGLKIVDIKYVPASGYGILSRFGRLFINNYTARWFPNLCAHSMRIKVTHEKSRVSSI